jgi:hypothetical protein
LNASESQKSQSRYAEMVDALCLCQRGETEDQRQLRIRLLLARDVNQAQAARLAGVHAHPDLIGVYRLGSQIAGEAAFGRDVLFLNKAIAYARQAYQLGQNLEVAGLSQ